MLYVFALPSSFELRHHKEALEIHSSLETPDF